MITKYIELLNEELKTKFKVPPKLKSNYKIGNDLSDISKWEAKAIKKNPSVEFKI